MKTILKKTNNSIVYTRRLLIGETAKKGYITIIDQTLVSGTSFFILFFLARKLPNSEYGSFVLAWTTLIILNSVLNAIITSPLSVIGAQKYGEELKEYLGSSFLVLLILGGTLSLLMIIISCVIAFKGLYSEIVTSTFIGMSVSSFFVIGQDFFRRLFITKMEIKRAFYNDFFTSITKILGIIVLLITQKLTTQNAFFAIALGSMFGYVDGYLHMQSLMKFKYSNISKTLRENWKLGKWLVAELIPYSLSGQIYIYIVAIFLSLEATGAYAASQNIFSLINVYTTSIVSLFTPIASHKCLKQGKLGMYNFMNRNTWIVFSPVIIYCIGVSLFSETVLKLFYRDKYSGFGGLIIILAIQTVFQFIYRYKQVMLLALKRTDVGFYAKMISAGVTLLLAYPMLKYFNVYGAAMNTTITTFIFVMTYTSFLKLIMNESKIGFIKI